MVHVILKKTCHTCFTHIVLHLIFVALCGEEWCLNTVFTDIARKLKLRTCLVIQSICVLNIMLQVWKINLEIHNILIIIFKKKITSHNLCSAYRLSNARLKNISLNNHVIHLLLQSLWQPLKIVFVYKRISNYEMWSNSVTIIYFQILIIV